MTYFHPEEEFQFGVLSVYDDEHPGTRYLIKYPDGERYICRYFTDYESENGGDLSIEMEDYGTTSSIKLRWTSSRRFRPAAGATRTG
jgi:hypothetical protein